MNVTLDPLRRGESETGETSTKSSSELFERCLHVVALASVTIAQPLLDLLARHAEFLVAHRFTRIELGFLVVSLLVLVPMPVVVLELLVARAPDRVGRVVHGLVVAFLVALFCLLTLKHRGLSATVILLIAVLAGVAFALVYLQAGWLRFFVSVLALAIIAVPAAFFADSQVRKLTSTRQASLHELPSVASTAPIVFIIFDEFPTSVLLDEQAEINRHRYPNLAGLAQTATWFANAVGVAETSESAISAILTGSYPRPGHLPTLKDYPRNLFTLFGAGYQIWAREPMSAFCPSELNRQIDEASEPSRSVTFDLAIVYLHLIVPKPWDAHLPPIDTGWRDFAPAAARKKSFFAAAVEAGRRDRRQEFASLRSALRQSSNPGLYFLHVLLPHRPWEFSPQGHRYANGDSIPGLYGGKWLDDEYLPRQAFQRLIAQVQFVDAEIGRIIHRLEEADLFDRSLIVLVGDHGASFRPGDTRRLISENNAHDIMPVPLLVKAPNQHQARRLEHPIGIVDVLPTVLDALDLESPWELEGLSGFDPEPRKIRFLTKERGTLDVERAVHHEKYATVRWKLELFGGGSDPLDLYRFGPAGDLVGRTVDELIDRGPGRWTASIKDLKLFEQVSLKDGAPVFVVGQIVGSAEAEPCCRLAVALNGTVYATTRTHTDTGRRRQFSVLLPHQGFRDGPNRIDVYQLVGNGEARQVPLRPAQQLP